MPKVIRCPNCNAPLDRLPTGPSATCPFCGVAMVATQWMPAPPVVPGPPLPPGALPSLPGDAVRRQVEAAIQVADARLRGRRVAVLSWTIGSLLVLVGAVALVFFSVLAKPTPGSSSAPSSATTAAAAPDVGDTTVELPARPAPQVAIGASTDTTLEPDARTAAAVFAADRAGEYALVAETDASGSLALYGADGTRVAEARRDDARGRAELSRALRPATYRMQFETNSPDSERRPVTFAVVRADPQPLATDTTVSGTLGRFDSSAKYLVTVSSPIGLRARLTTAAGDCRVRIERSDGTPVVAAVDARPGSPADAATDGPVQPGDYRVIVDSDDPRPGASFQLRVKALTGGLEPLEEDERADFQRLHGCACRANAGGPAGPENVGMALQVVGTTHTLGGGGDRRSYDLAWAFTVGDRLWYGVPAVGPDAAPPTSIEGDLFGIALGCDGSTLVVASGYAASGWSLADGRRLWTASLDRPYPRGRGESDEGLAVNCDTLRVAHGAVLVPQEGASPVRLSTADGSAAR